MKAWDEGADETEIPFPDFKPRILSLDRDDKP